MKIRIMGFDPGSTNFAWAVTEINVRPFRYKVLGSGTLKYPIRDMKNNVPESAKRFRSEVVAIRKRFGATLGIAERFMTRGIKGATIEYISLMLAELLHVGFDDVKFITAAQWKNRWNKMATLDDFYKDVLVVPHQVDATSISIYGAALWYECPFFEFLGGKNGIAKYKKEIEATNEGKVIQRKGQGCGARVDSKPAQARQRSTVRRKAVPVR